LGHLSKDESKLTQIINIANDINPGEKGNTILDVMSKISGISEGEKLKRGEAILHSLLSPHRQLYLSTCTICPLINRDLHNHPERLAEIYSHILSVDNIHMPSGYSIC
jgi:hypothetical protein